MPNLISILNSGESLEKAAVLTKLAYDHNKNFYSEYKTISLYYNNLPREDSYLEVHGTLRGIIKNLKSNPQIKYKQLEDLWDDRVEILGKFFDSKEISEKLKSKLLIDKRRFEKIIPNMPWYSIFDSFKNFLMKEFLNNKGMNLAYLDTKKDIGSLFKNEGNINDGLMKYYLLNPDGNVSSKILWKESFVKKENLSYKEEKQIIQLEKSLVLSPNVFSFLLSLSNYSKGNGDIIGYRDFKRTQRAAYESGIKQISSQNDSRFIEEPRNALFNSLLDNVDATHGNIPIGEKITKAVYNYLNKVL